MDAEFEKAYEESLNEEQTTEQEVITQEEGTTEQVENIEVQTQEEVQEPTQEEPEKIKIDGLGEFTVDEIKEFRNGYMRQSDYTRKTQEIARQKQEIEALRTQATIQNPAFAGSPIAQRTQTPQTDLETRLIQLEQSVADKELDNMLTDLKTKYPDFDEVKVLNTAYEKGLTDLEFVYKSLREPEQVNVDSLKEQLRQEILNEIQKNKGMTSTIIANGNAPVQNKQVNLSSQELAIATELGLTPDEYLQYK